MAEEQGEIVKGLLETRQRTEASLLPAIEEHLSNDQFRPSQGLDFLNVKNSLLLSYMVELTYDLRRRLNGEGRSESSLERLHLLKTVIDKSRGLDKKLKYQIDKLLAAGSTASTFAAGMEAVEEDPLQFRPDIEAMEEEGGNEATSSSSSSSSDQEDVEDDDDELEAARMTLAKSRSGTSKKKKRPPQDEEDLDGNEGGVYRAPRLTSVPYTHDKQDVEVERERRQRRKLRASELAQTLRAQYGEAPEQEDTLGGAELGHHREAARRMAEREKEKSRYEEDNMVRLVTSRKDKKERKRLMREENSNLSAIADLNNLMKESQFGSRGGKNDEHADIFESKRHANGKRRKQLIDSDGKLVAGKSRKSVEAKNSLQKALFGDHGASGKKKGKKR